MKRTTVTFTIGALLVAGTAAVAPTQAAALELGHHAPTAVVPAAQRADISAAQHAVTTSAHRTASDTQQVATAIRHSKLLGAVKPSNVSVSKVKFAGSPHVWASALATPKNGQTDPAQVLLKKSGSSWTVRDLGTASIGCGIAPQTVRSTLGLHGPC